MVSLPSMDMEHSKIFDMYPLIGMAAIIGIMMIPAIPSSVKGPLIFVSFGILFVLMFTMDKIAAMEAAENVVIKATIFPYKIETEFHISKTVGRINSRYNPNTQSFVTPFKLANTKFIRELGIGAFDEFEIAHKGAWDTRNKPDKAWVHWNGVECIHANTYLCQLWYTGERAPKVGSSTDFLGYVPRFTLASGSEDYWLLKGKPYDEQELEVQQ